MTHWQLLERYLATDGKPVAACSPAGWKPAGRTRSASISPIAATRSWATRPTPPASKQRRRG